MFLFSLILQSGDIFHIKVVEITPQLTFLGANIDEAVHLQKEHDAVLKELQVYIYSIYLLQYI